MRRLHVKGIVRVANSVREALTAPMTPAERDRLARRLGQTLARIEHLLAANRATPAHLPPPSRRAYQFLKQVDLGRVELARPDETPERKPGVQAGTVWFPGLRAFLDCFLDDAAISLHAGLFKPEASLRILSQTTDRLNQTMRRDGFRAEHLKREARLLLGWFRYFSEQSTFAAYAEAVRRAQQVLGRLPLDRLGWKEPLLVHFRPSSHLYRCRPTTRGVRIILETPMISFDEPTLQRLGRQMLGGGNHQEAITGAMLEEGYQAVAAGLESAAGTVERTAGMYHDLAEVFDRVNAAYFDGRLPRPRMAWNRTFTRRTFGHYDFVHDRLWISTTLDRQDVPGYVLDHVMHHELLHKKHGFRWRSGQQHTHLPEFRAEERKFIHYDQAARFLDGLSTR